MYLEPSRADAGNPSENLAAELADVAYRVALRYGMGANWMELQFDLWESMTSALERRPTPR